MQANENSIRIDGLDVKGDTVSYRVSHRGSVGLFFADKTCYFKADHPLDSIPTGILVIPLLGCLVPMSWVADSQIEAGSVDSQYLSSLTHVRSAFQRAYPDMRIGGSLRAEPLQTDIALDRKRTSLLYSGGIDSTASFFRNRDSNPSLLMVKGTPDFGILERAYSRRLMDRLALPLKDLSVDLHIIETDILEMLDYEYLQASVRTESIHGWWENLAHGLFLASMCAPYTYHASVSRLLIASSDTAKTASPWGSMPESDERIQWCGIHVVHDSYDLTKFEKIRDVIVPFLRDEGKAGFPIKVCTGDEKMRLASMKLNCGRCDKCTRTMLMLLENGIDPSLCDFDVSGFSPRRIRIGLENGYMRLYEATRTWSFILDNARSVQPELEKKYPGTDALFRWLAGWDRQAKETRMRSFSRRIMPPGSSRRRFGRKLLGESQ